MTNQRKKKNRKAAKKAGMSYQALLNRKRHEYAARSDADSASMLDIASATGPNPTPAPTAGDGERELDGTRRKHLDEENDWSRDDFLRAMQGLTADDISWLFRETPRLIPAIVRRDLRRLGDEHDGWLCEMTSRLRHDSRAEYLAQTLPEAFDAWAARDRILNPWMSSRVLFNARVGSLYIRLGTERLEACVGGLERAKDPLSLFRQELEPLFRHAVKERGYILVEIAELRPALTAQLQEYLFETGWLDSTMCPEAGYYEGQPGTAFCKAGIDYVEAPTPAQREELSLWRQAQLQEQAKKLLAVSGVETPMPERHYESRFYALRYHRGATGERARSKRRTPPSTAP